MPVFLYLAFESGDGRELLRRRPIFWLIAFGDFVDGFLARATGQYSRMGALMDPIIDRLTVLSGCVVCWHFDLLPKWGAGDRRRPRGRHARERRDGPAPRHRHRDQLARAGSASPAS